MPEATLLCAVHGGPVGGDYASCCVCRSTVCALCAAAPEASVLVVKQGAVLCVVAARIGEGGHEA